MHRAAILAFALAACHSPSLTKVDLAAENKPPLAVTVSGSGITIPEAIGVAFVVTPYVDDKKSDDIVTTGAVTGGCVLDNGINKNEFFLQCGTPGMGSIMFEDSEKGYVNVPIVIGGQDGSVMWDGSIPEAAAGDDASSE